MKTIIINEPGDVENFVYADVEKPVINSDEVLVQVKAISINPVDAKVRAGQGIYQLLKNEEQLILGWDISGIVMEAGDDSIFKVGDEVFGLIRFPGHGRAYAEYIAAPINQLALKPANVTHAEAASSTLAALTAYQALLVHANLKRGQSVLVHAAAGGVGHFAVQMAKHLGAKVTGTSSEINKDFVLGLGVDEHIDYHTYNWKNSEARFDFVFDTVGGANIDKSLHVVKPFGTLISIPSGLSEDINERTKAKGVNGLFFLVSSNGDQMKIIAEWLAQDIIKPHISETFTFDQIAKAHKQIESGRTVGKIVVEL